MSVVGRRQFLRSVLAVPSAASAAVQRGARASESDPIVIVGAGLAGLRAAAVLHKAGLKVVVLEASGAAGGRVRTIRTPFAEGLYGEAGPIRIAGMQARVQQLVREHGLSLVPFAFSTGAALIHVRGETWRLPAGLKEADAKLALRPDEAGLGQGGLLQKYVRELPSDIGELQPTARSYSGWEALDRVTWPEWLRSKGASPGAVALMTLGGESTRLSALYVLRQFALLQSTDQFFKIEGGMDRLPRAMASALGPVVRYNAAVVRIDQSSRPVRIDYVEGGKARTTIRASRVIVTIPFSMLRQVEIAPTFSPSKARTIEELPYFPAVRFLLQSRKRFWEDADLSGTARSDQPAEVWDSTYDLPATRGLLGATVGGVLGRKLEGMTWDDSVKLGADLVTTIFPELRANFETGSVYRWTLDPWARGAFAVFHPGQMTAMMPAIATPEDRIHFAGEHTSSWMGWMEGALESGERAAAEVVTAQAGRGKLEP
jgi:monoamine oxidase